MHAHSDVAGHAVSVWWGVEFTFGEGVSGVRRFMWREVCGGNHGGR